MTFDRDGEVVDSVSLIIVGGGYWGTACALLAEERGIEYVLFDDNNPEGASRNAAGISQPHWYWGATIQKMWPSDWTRQAFTEGWNWMLANGLSPQKEWVRSYNGSDWKESEVYSIDKHYMERPRRRFRAKVLRLYENSDNGGWTVWTSHGAFHSRMVILAAGMWTDELLSSDGLQPCGVTGLYGRALLVANITERVKQYMKFITRPYTSFTLQVWGENIWRFGDTIEKQPDPNQIDFLKDTLAKWSGDGFEILGEMAGYRPCTGRFLVEQTRPNLVVATGGHRVGLGLSGLVAFQALKELGH